jgi:hypothetical protein
VIGDLFLKDPLSRYRLSTWALVVAGSLIVAPACGKRGPPLPPLRPLPAGVTNLTVTRRADSVTVRFTPPAANADGSVPLQLDRIDIFALTQASTAPPPDAAALRVPANRIATITPPARDTKNDAKDDAAVLSASTFVETVPSSAQTRFYQVVPYANRSRAGAASALVAVPLDAASKAPARGAIAYDEQTLTLTWPAADGAAYFVYNTADSSAPNVLLTAERLKTGTFTQPVVFDKRVCFVVRSVAGTAPVTIESPPSEEVCATPVDTFPPPAPAGLIALASPGGISLTWDAVTAADLGGYIVLRGEGSGDRLQPLMSEPVPGTSFKDESAKAGVRYFYAVVAVDKASPPNRSKNSNVVDEVGR